MFVLGPAAIARGSTAADVGSIERLAADTSGTPSLAAEPATSRCTVLVYCFELKPGQDVAKFSSHGGPSAIRHLAAAGVWPEAKLEPR